MAVLLALLGQQKPVYWKSPHDGSTHRITRLGPQWEEWPGATLEPALRLSGGKFAALANMEADDIVSSCLRSRASMSGKIGNDGKTVIRRACCPRRGGSSRWRYECT